jgi:hypothetical protein
MGLALAGIAQGLMGAVALTGVLDGRAAEPDCRLEPVGMTRFQFQPWRFLAAVALAADSFPALLAVRVEPMAALRAQ